MFSNSTYPRTGTTAPIFVSRDPKFTPLAVLPGQEYFLIQVYAAQVAFRGAPWDNIKRLVVTSQVNLHHRNLDNRPLRAIQRTRDVQQNQSQPLGLNPNLIHLVPAVMPSVSLAIDFVLDRENRLAQLGGLINTDSFFSVLSLAPGASAVAKTVAQLADKVIQTFIPAEESKPLLSFAGDFNLATQQLLDGYYVILGSKDERTPLPDPTARLAVRDHSLFVNDQPAAPWSYVIFDVRRTATRPRELSDGAPWDLKLCEAEDAAQRFTLNPLATDEERKQAWDKCLKLIEEAQTLLRVDDNFTRGDAQNIVAAAFRTCRQVIAQPSARHEARAKGGAVSSAAQANDLARLGLPATLDLDKVLDEYAMQLTHARKTLKAASLGQECA